jgi:alpha-L-fucosidase
MFSLRIFIGLFTALTASLTLSQEDELPISWVGMEPGQSQVVPLSQETEEERSNRLRWWRDARFGMFIHWSPICLKETEIGWSRDNGVPRGVYDQLYRDFDPSRFDADSIVNLAKSAGMKYLVFTTKHHDGFCMYDTREHEYSIMHSPYGKDICKQLAIACKKHDITFCTYYSVTDWYHPWHPLDSPSGTVTKPTGDIDKYEKLVHRQVAELVSKYGPIGIMWFDYPQGFSREQGKRLYDFTRSLQPSIIVNDRTGAGGDYHTPEQRLGKFNTTTPWESCITVGQQWSWRKSETPKSARHCLHALIRCAAGDGNLLLNVAPSPQGELDGEQAKILLEVGKWLQRYGEAVYGTRGGPFLPNEEWVTTHNGKVVYIHVLDSRSKVIRLPKVTATLNDSEFMTGTSGEIHSTDEGIEISLTGDQGNDLTTLIRLEFDRPIEESFNESP